MGLSSPKVRIFARVRMTRSMPARPELNKPELTVLLHSLLLPTTFSP